MNVCTSCHGSGCGTCAHQGSVRWTSRPFSYVTRDAHNREIQLTGELYESLDAMPRFRYYESPDWIVTASVASAIARRLGLTPAEQTEIFRMLCDGLTVEQVVGIETVEEWYE